MDQTKVLQHLRAFIRSKQSGEVHKKTAKWLAALGEITEKDIFFGDAPTYFFATITCNSTGVGRSRFQGTESQRTVAMDYVTDEYLFIDGDAKAGEKGLSLFFLKPGQVIHFYKKEDAVKLAKEFGFQLHLRDFRDLNYTLHDHRLNRHTVNVTRKPFTYPIRPIYASTEKYTKKFAIGYVYEQGGVEHVIIEPEDPQEVAKKRNALGCAPWMFLGFIFPPILIAAVFVMLFRIEKKRMRG